MIKPDPQDEEESRWLDENWPAIQARIKESVRREAAQDGRPLVYSKDGYLVFEYPNGSILQVKRLAYADVNPKPRKSYYHDCS